MALETAGTRAVCVYGVYLYIHRAQPDIFTYCLRVGAGKGGEGERASVTAVAAVGCFN